MTIFAVEPKFRASQTSLGIRVLTEHHPNARSIVMGCFLPLGSRHEPRDRQGLAHFYEHMVFKGTRSRTAYQLASELEAYGGEINAYTTKEYICFHASCLREHAGVALDVLLDLVGEPLFDMAEIEKEKAVVAQEIDMSKDDIEDCIFDDFLAEFYPNNSLGYPILGTPEHLAQITRNDLENFMKNAADPKGLIISAAGYVDHDDLCAIVERLSEAHQLRDSSHSPPSPKLSEPLVPQARTFQKSVPRKSEQTHVLIGCPSPSFVAPERFCAYIMHAYLGGGMTSLLYQKIREELGLAYSVYSSLSTFTDAGLMQVYAGVRGDRLAVLGQVLVNELKKLVEDSIPDEQIDFFKTQVRGQLILAAEDWENRMTSLAINEMSFGEYRHPGAVIDELERVDSTRMRHYWSDQYRPGAWSRMVIGDAQQDELKAFFDVWA